MLAGEGRNGPRQLYRWEADQLRKSKATFKFTSGISKFKDKLVSGMERNGYSREFAEKTFSQLEGFGSYGFPESHAASFALIAYASSFVKCHYPDAFRAALLNSQPMGFYAPAQVVGEFQLWICRYGIAGPLSGPSICSYYVLI